ncbi:hypothetical protein N561_09345 [Gallibacterium anatis 12656/12]|uniref:Uncharacterized protein n=1 Tax=Gallibacterium anatis 12656/12 TaxID=1195244 RepID=U1I6L7_9PAST|nr:hypothetical protein N561_09345 [Gallibacterium anatis 12656/12]
MGYSFYLIVVKKMCDAQNSLLHTTQLKKVVN